MIPAGFFVSANGTLNSLRFPAIRGLLRGSNMAKPLILYAIKINLTQFCAFPGVKGLYLIVTNFLPLIAIHRRS